jgi:uncharacterized surface protein with fasciclin (FAS1) repeats
MNRLLPLGILAAALALAGCDQGGQDNSANGAANGSDSAAEKTIAAGLDQDGRFFQAAKAAGLDATLAGAGPYTVLVPGNDAFGQVEGGALNDPANPQNRAELTRVLTYHILPGTILAEDIGKAIENAKGPAMLATMGGGTLTATREGDRIVLTDAGGGKATVTQADERFSNGVVHHIDTVLVPGEGGAAPQSASSNSQ